MDSLAPTRLHVLVVDDIAASRDTLCALVRELGHEVTPIDGGSAAVAWTRTHRPDVVLLDLLMPEMDGFDVTRRIRELDAQRWLPLIVTSSLQGEQHFIEALASGADDYLARPVNPALLDAKLRHYGRILGLQSRLAALAQRQRDIQDNIVDAVLTLDERGNVVDANLAACRAFGDGTPHGVVGVDVVVVTGADREALLGSAPLTLSRQGGQPFPAEVAASQWRESGSVRTTLIVRDLSEQHRGERMRDEFLATVSHELRTPLTSVLGAVGLLASGATGALPAAAMPLVAAAQRNGERLSKLIDDILDLTKLEGDRLVLHMRAQPLAQLVREAVVANQGYADAARVRLRCDIDDDTPLSANHVRVDADRLLQVLANLLSNAIKHSPTGETVTVRLATRAGGLQVTVSDQGPGIDPQFRAQLFEKFSQADATDRRAIGGTGLGLYITRLLVERMGGQVDVASGGEAGAAFSVWFPFAAADTSLARSRLLLIDCDADTRRRVVGWLGALGRVEGFANLGSVGAAPSAPFDLVLANPQSQGQTDAFCAGVRRLAGQAPVLLLSDSVGAEFAVTQGFGWLSAAQTDAAALRDAVLATLKRRTDRPPRETAR